MDNRGSVAPFARNPSRHVSAAVAACLTGWACLATPVHAQAIDDRAWIDIGAFVPSVDSHVQINSTAGRGTGLDFETDLGLDHNKTLPAVSGGIRVSTRFRVTGEFYALNRSGSKTLARDIVVEDVTYPAAIKLSSALNTDIYRATVGYSFIRNEQFELGGAVGLHLTNIEASFSGQGRIGTAALTSMVRKKKALAPLPTVGVYGSWAPAPKVTVAAHVDFLKLKISDYEGKLVNAEVSAAYRVLRNVGVGVVYRYVDYELGATKPKFNGQVDYTYKGPSIFLHLAY